ncbi:AraC family transcriptional regulator [Bradyrhizobium sp. 2TAF24]|uniref:AraC family transcriptional regulator n=1 Tax=Bradyrhizobium sp. 2TAF24 TaxID=3233011 RepID=UPI003F8F7171
MDITTMEADVRPRRAMRLAGFSRVATGRLDDAAEEVGRIFCPHELVPLRGATGDFYARHNCAAYDGISVNYVAYGGSVSIDPGCLERFFLLQIPLAGSARIRTATRDLPTAPGVTASLLSPTLPTRMAWQDDCAQLILLVGRQLVEQRAAALAGKPVRPVEFDPAVDLATPAGQGLHAQVEHLVDFAEQLGPDRRLPPLAAADLREGLLDALLNGQRHGLSAAIEIFAGRAESLPCALRRARDFLHANATEPLDLADLAAAAGTGIRALQLGFRRHFGTSISEMLLDVRLAHLHARLKTAPADARIIDIAFELGFSHLSRMASAYRAKFGETPSATLRRMS